MTKPVAVAITGGIGAGKSEALQAFARHGAATVSSDEIVHHLLRREDVRRAVVEHMGNGVVAPDGEMTAVHLAPSSSTTALRSRGSRNCCTRSSRSSISSGANSSLSCRRHPPSR